MEFENQDLVVVLNHAGRGALRDLGIDTESSPVLFHALEKDEQGIWILHQREDGDHVVLIRSEHMQALDVARGEVRPEGPIH
jgi:hypothetical protein